MVGCRTGTFCPLGWDALEISLPVPAGFCDCKPPDTGFWIFCTVSGRIFCSFCPEERFRSCAVCRLGFGIAPVCRTVFCPCAVGFGCADGSLPDWGGTAADRCGAPVGRDCDTFPGSSVRFRRRLCSLARLICSRRESAVLRGTENCRVSLKFFSFPDLFVRLPSLLWDQVCTPNRVAATNSTTTARYAGEKTDCASERSAPPFLRTTYSEGRFSLAYPAYRFPASQT